MPFPNYIRGRCCCCCSSGSLSAEATLLLRIEEPVVAVAAVGSTDTAPGRPAIQLVASFQQQKQQSSFHFHSMTKRSRRHVVVTAADGSGATILVVFAVLPRIAALSDAFLVVLSYAAPVSETETAPGRLARLKDLVLLSQLLP